MTILKKYGENLYNLLPGGNRIATDANIEQGTIETSNVNVVNDGKYDYNSESL